ncbi:MAG: DinB family protein [Gemmatimonadota bacterium]
MHNEVADLLEMLRQAWGPRSWHGTGLAGSVRGVPPAQAMWRPGPGRHNIWELVLHLAYWKYAVTRRLEGGPKGGFPRDGSDWIAIADTSEAAWKADVKLLHAQHKALLETVSRFPARRLNLREKTRWTNREQIVGIASHDLYHTGQIQLLKKLSGMGERSLVFP